MINVDDRPQITHLLEQFLFEHFAERNGGAVRMVMPSVEIHDLDDFWRGGAGSTRQPF
ncbi:MAG: hypothetical protein IPM03_15915 [Sulfuritalea sp.]|nr:hypothetical protein [Sulfuritalea sp.]